MWLLPTLNRIEKLKEFIRHARGTETSTPGYILVDKEDFEANQKAYESIEHLPDWDFFITKAVTMGDKCREFMFTQKFMAEDIKWVGILNDDHVPITKGWDVKLVTRLDGKNFISANDRWMAPIKATTATAWSMPLLKCVGWPIFPPGLHHLFIDDVWEQLGKHTGCWRIAMDVVVEHRHVIKDASLNDATHEKVYSQKSWDMDKAVFDNFMKHDFQATVMKIRKFQDMLPGQAYNPAPKKEATNV